MTKLRPMVLADVPQTAALWYYGWVDGHADHVPPRLVAFRTKDSFAARLVDMLDDCIVATDSKRILGFCAVKPAEIDQLYIQSDARGSGLAAQLLQAGEDRLRTNSHRVAHLLCLEQNEHAARFYKRQGWIATEVKDTVLPATREPVSVPCIIFQKQLLPADGNQQGG